MCKEVELKCSVNPSVRLSLEKFLSCKGIDLSLLSSAERVSIINKLESACKSCDLHYQAGNLPSLLRPESPYVFLSRNPNKWDCRSKTLFDSGNACGAMFQQYIKYLGIEQNNYSIINICSCGDLHNSPITPYQVSQCSCLTKLALETLDNLQIIFPISRDALSWLIGHDVDVTQAVGEIYISECNGNKVLIVPLPHPSSLLTDRELVTSTKTVLEYIRNNVISVYNK